MNTRLRQDSRDAHIKDYFGSPASIPLQWELDRGLTNPIEGQTDTDCTSISACDVACNQTGTQYNVLTLWALTPKTDSGADPRDSMQTMIDHGLEPLNGGPLDNRWTSYMRSDGNSGDYFATTQASLTMTQSPTTVASPWYSNWDSVLPDGVMPMGDVVVSGHDYEITGWRQGQNEPEFHVKAWLGYYMWMPKSVFNKVMDTYGSIALIPTTKAIQATERSYFQAIIDTIVNILLDIQRQINLLKT